MPAGEIKTSPSLKVGKDNNEATLEFVIPGTESESTALSTLKSLAPASILVDGVLCLLEDLELDHEDYGVWTGSASYKSTDKKEDEEEPPADLAYAVSFETGGGTIKINKSLETKQVRSTTGDEAVDTFKNMIGVTPDGIEGVEIGDPVFRWTETIEIPIASFTKTFVRTVAYATKKTNSAIFRGFPIGEVLFEGASASTTDGFTKASISFNFAHSKNETGLTIGPITGVNKKGWEYLWISLADEVETYGSSEKVIVKTPKMVVVERVYDSTNFITELGLPAD